MQNSTPHLDQLRTTLVMPGKLLVFIDDTGTPGSKLGDHLVRDFKAHVAIVVKSENYAGYLAAHAHFLNTYNWAGEFHSNEVFQGKKAWAHCDTKIRQDAFDMFVDMIGKWVESMYYIYAGIDQYNEMTRTARTLGSLYPENVNWKSHGEGSRIVLLKSIINRIGKTHRRPIVIVEDAETGKHDVMEVMFQESCNVDNSCVYRIDSQNIPGLQLADLAAFCFNRRYHIVEKRAESKPLRELDNNVIAFWGKYSDKYIDSLSKFPAQNEMRVMRNRRKREQRGKR